MTSEQVPSRLSPRRPRMTVLAESPAGAVRAAGGWLFDRALAGWEVRVLTLLPGDRRPLQILGAHPYDDPSGTAEVWLLNGHSAGPAEGSMTAVRHQLSLAARAFKAHALRAADLPGEAVTDIETFRAWAGRPGSQFAPPARGPATAAWPTRAPRRARRRDSTRELISLLHGDAR
jgi:hypothetical protein